MTPAPARPSAWPAVVFAGTAGVLVALLVKLFLSPDAPAALVLAVVVAAGLMVLSPRVFELAELTLSKDGLVAKVREAERKAERAERRLDVLFAYTMSDGMYQNLRKLASGRFGPYYRNPGLERELRHLRDIGYIDPAVPVGQLPAAGNDLSAFVRVTPTGQQFVALRDEIEAKAAESEAARPG